jgi:glycosyltransferase involved in cell wall biosynthesis
MTVIDLSRSFGKEAALTAGLDYARGDAVIPMDADLQDPPELIPDMVASWKGGAEIVLARRLNRDSDSTLKRFTAKWFYRMHNAISHTRIPENVGDFRLINRQALDAIMQLRERHRFMKGLFAWVGFRQVEIGYVRPIRAEGRSQFSGWRLWNFAIEGFTSFSTLPLRLWTYIGFLVATVAFAYGCWTIVRTLIFGIAVPGYASLVTLVLFFGGLNLFGLGVIGEYLGRVFTETKQRPLYVMRSVYRGLGASGSELQDGREVVR